MSTDSSLRQITGSLGQRGRRVKGRIVSPRRVSGWRRYDSSVLARLQVIRAARDLGFSLDEIQILLRNYSDDAPPAEMWRGLAAKKFPEVQESIRRAEALQLLLVNSSDCACATVDECLETSFGRSNPAAKAGLTARSLALEPALAALPAWL